MYQPHVGKSLIYYEVNKISIKAMSYSPIFLTSMQPQCAKFWKIHASIYIERIWFHLKDSVQRTLLEMALTVKFCFGNYYRKSQVSSCPSLKQHYTLFISDRLLSVKLHVITLLAYITAYFWPKILNTGNRDSLKDLIVSSFLDPRHLHVPTVYQQNWKYS